MPDPSPRHLSWQQFDAAVEQIVALGPPPHCSGVYGIPRGGLVLAVALSHRLELPLLAAPQPRCLVVDEVAETGRSLEPFRRLEGVRLVVWISKIEPRGWWAVETTTAADWLVFPWEDPRRAAADEGAYRRSRG
jgi:hypoxanthine phosphoribosyltransferase